MNVFRSRWRYHPLATGQHPLLTSKAVTFAAHRTDDTVVVKLAGQLDMAATFTLEPALERLTRETAARPVGAARDPRDP
jgi:hypothetical protein